MTAAIADADIDELDDEEEYGSSLAVPPLYVLRTAAHCPECGQAQHVYTLGCAAFCEAGDSRPVEDFHFLRVIHNVPEPVLNLLKDRCSGYYLDHEAVDERLDERPYLMNHCRCGAKLDDDCVNGDIGATFWPDTPEGYGDFKLFLLPVEEPIPVESNYMLGGGEYLDLDNAKPWTEL
jgi:hypothetical protein